MNARELRASLTKKYKEEYFKLMDATFETLGKDDIDEEIKRLRGERIDVYLEILTDLSSPAEVTELESLTEIEWEKRQVLKLRNSPPKI